MDNADTEKDAEAWRDVKNAKSLVGNLGEDDRITVDRRIDSETGRVEETYTLYKSLDEPAPIFKSGDCAAVRKAIELGSLEPIDKTTYRKQRGKP